MQFTSSKNRVTASLMVLTMLVTISAISLKETKVEAATPAQSLVEGEDQDFITKFPFEKPKKPVVVEFFSFMCQHCFKYENTILRWKKQKPESVEIVKIPVTFGRPAWQLAAKSFYISEELGVADKFSKLMFKKIHIERKSPRKLADLENIFAELGVSKSDFNKTASSFAVDSKMRKADYLVKKYKVQSVPYILINFKYEAGKKATQSEKSLFKLWNLLPQRDF